MILGLDIGQNYAFCCPLIEFPNNIQQYFAKNRKNFVKLRPTKEGIEQLLSFEPTAIIMEPTGFWYSQFWYLVAKKYDIDVYWVGHTDLSGMRSSYGFTNKRDDEDSLCLAACYYDDKFINKYGEKRFLENYLVDETYQLKQLYFQRGQLTKLRSNLISQLKQRLSFEYPELAARQFYISKQNGITPSIAWLAGKTASSKIQLTYEKSIAHSLNIEISKYTGYHAELIYEVEARLRTINNDLQEIIIKPEFAPYMRVFDTFNFGLANKALLLNAIYPFDKFLSGGKQRIDYEYSNGRLQKRNRSLGQFQSFLGMAHKLSFSGNKNIKRFSGSTVIRSSLYTWALMMVAPTKDRINSDVGLKLSAKYQNMKSRGIKGKDALVRVLFTSTRYLYKELYKELVK